MRNSRSAGRLLDCLSVCLYALSTYVLMYILRTYAGLLGPRLVSCIGEYMPEKHVRICMYVRVRTGWRCSSLTRQSRQYSLSHKLERGP